MKLTTEEQSQLSKLNEKKVEDLTTEEKAELEKLLEKEKAPEPKDEDYKGPLDQEAFNRIFAENKTHQRKASEAREKAEKLQKKLEDEETEEKRKRGEFEKLYGEEKVKREALEAVVAKYQAVDAGKWAGLKAKLTPEHSKSFQDGDTPEIIASNIAKFDEWVANGFIKADGKGGGGGPAGGHEDVTWEKLVADPILMDKFQREHPQQFEELKPGKKR